MFFKNESSDAEGGQRSEVRGRHKQTTDGPDVSALMETVGPVLHVLLIICPGFMLSVTPRFLPSSGFLVARPLRAPPANEPNAPFMESQRHSQRTPGGTACWSWSLGPELQTDTTALNLTATRRLSLLTTHTHSCEVTAASSRPPRWRSINSALS